MKTAFFAATCAALLFVTSAIAQEMSEPQGAVVLTVTGNINRTNGDGAARFDLDMLRAVGETEVVTDTIWTTGDLVFTGVQLVDLLAYLGAGEGDLSARAINDYAVNVPVTDAVEGGPIIAYEVDGNTMSRREKGPLWLVYPYAASSDYRTEVIYARSIWQLDRMTIGE
ncbi:oxidoreductase [Antarctobacter heliothermus]|uniref:Oxidoreductase n=1 Tax=Antarctobacter heliothermus TaxID=74033 RepID=A0A222E650_9RHOB|nr:molybdopterin-dependent oxidoreductase [Antarctobacter heliothermus]ASP21632.1 oxidoreductase [Antarctobacter heliothermus]